MKKMLLLIAIMISAIGFSANAATVKLENAGEDLISISGTADAGDVVSVMILNPGYSENDILANPTSSIQYYGKTSAKNDGSFSLQIGMNDLGEQLATDDEPVSSGGGKFTLLLSTADMLKPETSTFEFYYADKKLEIIDGFNDEDSDMILLTKEAYTVYSLGESEIYKAVSTGAIASVLENTDSFKYDVDAMYKSLREALAIAAYNEGVEPLVVNGVLEYADVIGIKDTSLHNDYLEALSDTGRAKVNSGIMANGYESVNEIAEEFNELVLLNLICNYGAELGYGHVENYFEKYHDEYIDAGIDVDEMKDITDKNSVYNKLADSDADSFEELIEIYEEALEDADEPPVNKPKPGSSGGGGGGSAGGKVPTSGVASGSGFVVNPVALVTPFEDVEDVVWAKESISELYKRGVIAGKSEKVFAPHDTVTREEFTKMVISALFGEPENTETEFTDVSGWSVPYIASAAEKNIVSGISEGVFDPKGKVTREQAATIIARSLTSGGYTLEKKGAAFADKADISLWALESITALTGEGVLSGKDNGNFCPKDFMTRAEAAKVIYYSLKLMGGAN